MIPWWRSNPWDQVWWYRLEGFLIQTKRIRATLLVIPNPDKIKRTIASVVSYGWQVGSWVVFVTVCPPITLPIGIDAIARIHAGCLCLLFSLLIALFFLSGFVRNPCFNDTWVLMIGERKRDDQIARHSEKHFFSFCHRFLILFSLCPTILFFTSRFFLLFVSIHFSWKGVWHLFCRVSAILLPSLSLPLHLRLFPQNKRW